MKSIYLASVIAVFALTACQGQDVFKHQSNSLAAFQDLSNKSVPLTDFTPKQNPAAPDNSQFACYEGFKIQVEHDVAFHTVYFVEGVQDSVTINVESLLDNGKPWDVKPFNGKLPAGATFQRLNQQGSKGTYVFTWTPARGDTSDVVIQKLALQYVSDADRLCGAQTHQLQYVNLAVKKNDGQPSIKVSAYGELEYGKSLTLDVTVVDPSASATLPPTLKKSFDSDGANNGEHARVLDATQALNCPEEKREFKDNWVFHCTFDSRQIADAELQTVLGKGEVHEGELWLSAQSPRSHLSTPTTPVSVRIQFPLTAAAAAAAAKPAEGQGFSAPDASDASTASTATTAPTTAQKTAPKKSPATTKSSKPATKKSAQGAQ